MAPTTVLLVRHGETDWNRDRRIQGQSDPPLNAAGREQARDLAERLAGTRLDAVYASDLRRARETAEILAARLAMPVVVDPQLRELDFGSWEGWTVEELQERDPENVARWLETGEAVWERGETHADLARRVRTAVARLAEIHAGGQILLVAHGGPVRALLMEAEGLDFVTRRREFPRIENCALSRIAVEDGRLRRVD
ncbi:MAG: histidine phosphatase family protein [Thermoleophilia bacterium]|nr:histidine phosphatase family protein [Thermoleophilia bacterium]